MLWPLGHRMPRLTAGLFSHALNSERVVHVITHALKFHIWLARQ